MIGYAARLVLSSALACLLFVSVAAAQAIPLDPGKPIQRTVGGAGTTAYFISGVAGTKVRIAFTGSGWNVLTVYSPTGEAMLQTKGGRDLALDVILPANEVYPVTVSRDGLNPYRLEAIYHAPTAAEFVLASGVGYADKDHEESCWAEPGKVRRNRWRAGYVELMTLEGDTIHTQLIKDGRPFTRDGLPSEWRTRWDYRAADRSILGYERGGAVSNLGPYWGNLIRSFVTFKGYSCRE